MIDTVTESLEAKFDENIERSLDEYCYFKEKDNENNISKEEK